MVIEGAYLMREGGMKGEENLWMMVMEMCSLWLPLLWKKTRTTCEVIDEAFGAGNCCLL